jgi:hypothetical protein
LQNKQKKKINIDSNQANAASKCLFYPWENIWSTHHLFDDVFIGRQWDGYFDRKSCNLSVNLHFHFPDLLNFFHSIKDVEKIGKSWKFSVKNVVFILNFLTPYRVRANIV